MTMNDSKRRPKRLWARCGRRGTALLMATALSTGALTACSSEPAPEATTTAIVATTRAGMTPLSDSQGRLGSFITDQLLGTLAKGAGTVSVVRADGRPELVSTVRLKYDDTSRVTIEDSARANSAALQKALAATRAQNAQADVLGALSLAADAVRGQPTPTIYVIDNGLVTTGQVLLQTGLITPSADPAALAARVSVSRLDGVTVRWRGICATTGSQVACPEYAKSYLRHFLTAVVQNAGGKIQIDDAPLPTQIRDAGVLPEVDPVPFSLTPVTANQKAPLSLVLTNDSLRFAPDSSEYADPPSAERVLSDVAAALQAGQYARGVVAGCSNDDRPRSSEEAMIRRGQSRAERVSADLQRLGVTTVLTPTSFGYRCPGYVPTSPDANRKVIITAE